MWVPYLLLLLTVTLFPQYSEAELTPPYFNLAENRTIHATATCGVDTNEPELYCKLVGGANTENDQETTKYEVIQGQVCDYCDPNDPEKAHPATYAIDGTENWWQSPPLSRGMKYNEVNLTIDFGQEFHVAYLYIRMGNSPRPGLWTLEKSNDYGKTWSAWQHFSDSPADCETYFGKDSLRPITADDDVICTTEYSKIVPLENGEIPVTLLTGRPSANDYFNSPTLQEWTRATNVRIRLLRTKNLLGHLMSVARQDPTVTRRYFYSIKDISIGGRCVCNGHARTCGLLDARDPKRTLACYCQHNTCGVQCDKCCPGYEQKKWRQNTKSQPFICEPCNCHGHSNQCEYDEETDNKSLSLDIHGNYEGGGVCQGCQHNTEGINCNKCKPTFYRPYGKHWNETDVCQPCNCNFHYSTGNCEEETGRCECRKEFEKPKCDRCSYGHFGYPDCRPCECNLDGTDKYQCEAEDGKCPCKANFAGDHCDQCASGYYNFSSCVACDCNSIGSSGSECEQESGQCSCKPNFAGKQCDVCKDGYFNYPECTYCNCDLQGTVESICDKDDGKCVCRPGYGGARCDKCLPGFFGYPDCVPCNCSTAGSVSTVCDHTGRCPCLSNFGGKQCTSCQAGYYQYPECITCACDPHGSIGISCNNEGQCQCANNFDGKQCNLCKEGFYNYPACEECNCDPAGVIAKFAGCGSVPAGELCQCKERVQGRICNECRPLYWNLTATNYHGCEECDCFIEGTIGALDTCDTKTGQCTCKPSIGSRNCGECKDGSFDLFGGNLFGCKDCGCDIGGSAHAVCHKVTGQCKCHPRVSGRTCNHPLTTHYYPTLYQFQFEYEDGYTSSGSQVRYQYDEALFPEFSKKGYAVFSQLQNEVINEVTIYKSSVYRLVIRYSNPTGDNIVGTILITSDNPLEDEQHAKVLFKPTTSPQFVTVSGIKGDIPSPVVLDPGRYQISMKSDTPNLLLDYFVLLPAAYYEASILTRNIETPCEVGGTNLCRHYGYPSVRQFNPTYAPFITEGDESFKSQDYYKDYEHLAAIGETEIPLLSNIQPQLNYMMRVNNHGKYILVVDYITDTNLTDNAILSVNLQNDLDQDGAITVYPCLYTTICRAPVVDKEAREKVFFLEVDDLRPIEILRASEIDIGIKSVTAIPYEEWSTDYITPSPVCIYEDGVCVQSNFQSAPEARKVDFVPESLGGGENVTSLMTLDSEMKTISISSTVPEPSRYVVILHYNQPNHPNFNLHYNLNTERQNYDGKIHLKHCPSHMGCRQLVTQNNGYIWFEIDDAFTFNLTNGYRNKDVFLNNIILVPADVYKESLLHEGTYDQTKEFIHKCGQDHFYIPLNASDFCKNAVFSLTTAYNDGSLPCGCDYIGSTSFECEPFGGQCQCKPNVIGRQCDACRTGFYGFPDCKPCDCPATALCEKETGACICPPRVRGDKCNKCDELTFGFDPIIGCEDCNCHPQGVLNGNLQCDLNNGSCPCRQNIVGRTCELCDYGYHNFPACYMCDCNRDGTTFEICDQADAHCFCKKNVEGRSCERCKEGTYNLQKNNPEGCTKCFCFGKTTRCEQAYLKPFNVSMLNNVTVNRIIIDGGKVDFHQWEDDADRQLDETTVKVEFNTVGDTELLKGNTYVGCLDYLLAQNNHLSSYGGHLSYKILFANGPFGSAIVAPDIILKSNKTIIVHTSYEQPAPRTLFNGSVHFVETNFYTPAGLPVTREQFMTVLRDLDAIYVRASYWEGGLETTVSDVYLTLADEDYENPNEYRALSVERCECPPGYQGLSCEDCAPGFYRDPNGPYGGYCIPCDCHGHADTCDCNTGICQDCKHYTTGDHCDQCIAGYYGNATRGYPDDCMICACPLPVESNNFADSCEVSEDGYLIRCQCKPGYTGETCQSCDNGFYGQPEIEGEICKPCQCNGNIDPTMAGACDTVSGECILCMNNTFGAACNLCAPGFYGDAIELKDCKSCSCNDTGTERCDNYNGKCQCLPNVIGDKCDRCDFDHYGFDSGYGCQTCDCAEASNSTQCDDHSGQCPCKPGVTGKYCDRCLPGYWNYGKDGCEHCKCNTEFSRGLGCDARTGQCQCLPGVVGEKCDRCPHRWVLIPDAGCFVCDECHHALLDVTDQLRIDIDSVKDEFEEASQPYFTARKLEYYDDAIKNLVPEVSRLDPKGVNLSPFVKEIDQLLSNARGLQKRANYSVDYVTDAIKDGQATQIKANDALDDCRLVNNNARNAARDVERLADSFYGSESPKLDLALSEAQSLLDLIKQEDKSVDGTEQKERSESVLDEVQAYAEPVKKQADQLKKLKDDIGKFDERLEDLFVRAGESRQKSEDAEFLNGKNKRSQLAAKFDTINNSSKQMDKSINEGRNLINDADRVLENVYNDHKLLDEAKTEIKDTNNNAEKALEQQENAYDELNNLIRNAQIKAEQLENSADLLNREYSNTTSYSALKAARSYDDIVATTDLAREAAKVALLAAGNATELTDGIGIRAGESDQVARDLLSEGREALKKVQSVLQPHLNRSAQNVQKIKDMNQESEELLLKINGGLDGIPAESYDKIWNEAIEMAEDAEDNAKEDLKAIKPIIKELPEALTLARQIPKDVDETSKSIGQINTHLDRVKNQLPEILKLDEDVGKAQDRLASKLSAITEQLEAIKQNVKLAREKANDINVGLQFYPNTTLELKPPENLAVLSNTQVSAYFKTDRPNGFLFYLGNEAKPGGRPGKNEDFMELELENGYPVLNVDLGNGPEKIIGKQYVADDKWYQVIVDRTGNNVKLQIRDQDENGEEVFTETPHVLPGDQNLFNWDDNSRIFVGGYPPDYKMQDSVKYNSFSGQIEDFRIGNEPVGLWNFVDGQSNTDGAQERDRLLTADVPSNGLRFGGNGYVALDAKPYRFSDKSSIAFKFKAARDSPDGLLFYAGSERHLIAVELKDGDIVFQFKLGEKAESVKIQASQKLNDDQWHTVLAERDGRIGVLKVDDNQIFQAEDVYGAQGSQIDGYLDPSDVMYFGGVPNRIPHTEVTTKSFDGCIQDVHLAGTAVDLNRNLRALDVRPGCPVKTSSILSYNPGEVGYLKNENITANNNFVINLKFRTKEDRGLIFFVTDPDQSATFSLAIEEGILVLRSNNEELNSGKNRYDNGEWHVVTATHQSNRLRLSIDDVFATDSEGPPAPLYIQNGHIYFGGLPKGFRAKSGTVSTDAYFLGCISDVTINSQLVNFAQSVDRQNAVLDQCPRDLFDYDPFQIPTYYPDGRIEHKLSPEEYEKTKLRPDHGAGHIDTRFGEDGDDDKLNQVDPDDEDNHLPIKPEPSIPKTTTSTTTKRPRPTKRPLPKEPVCALSPTPNLDVDFDAGWRFGTGQFSRVEFDFKPKNKKQYIISLEFKTSNPDGLLFYASDERHTDFIAVYLRNGYIHHSFNCGSGKSNMTSELQYNDNEWHSVRFSRNETRGRLLVDDTDASQGDSEGTTRSMQLVPTYFVGGFKKEDLEDVAVNIALDKEQLEKRMFFGCIRNVKVTGKSIGDPSFIHNVQPCSEQIEPGVFFENGYVKLREKFRIGKEVKISFDIKPRSQNGFIMSVHGKKAFFIIELVNGTIQVNVDNGDGPNVAKFTPEEGENFCDGKWRTIMATKSLFITTLTVNNVVAEPAIGNSYYTSTDTTRPLFLGGHQHIKKLRGLTVRTPFQGCIRNFKINDVPENISTKMIVGNVQAGVCPTT